jgi:hypothetical protein
MSGGPIRNYFDYIVKPHGDSDAFFHNKSSLNHSFFVNRLAVYSGVAEGFSASHGLVKDQVSGLYLPALWESRLPTSSGDSVPMTGLAQNMAVLRGIGMSDSHSLGRSLQTAPLGKASINGAVADASGSPVPAVNFSNSNYFRSEKGLSQTILRTSDRNPMETALKAFSGVTHGDFEAGIDRVLDVIRSLSTEKNKLLPVTHNDRLNARKILGKSVDTLAAQFPTIKQKYEDLIKKALSAEFALPDSDGLKLSPMKTPHFRYTSTDEVYVANPDLTTLFTDSSTLSGLSGSMAVAEIMLTGCNLAYSFSSYIGLGVGYLEGLDLKVGNGAQATGSIVEFDNDSHYAGNILHLYIYHRYYRALSACLYELIGKLKSVPISGGTLFDRTVIDLNSEFNRVGGENGYGTAHGGMYSGRTLFSGMIPRLTVAGNVYSNGTYYGPGGCAAPVKAFSGQIAGIGNVCATVAKLLGVAAPTPNHAPFLVLDSSKKAILAVEEPQNVKNG